MASLEPQKITHLWRGCRQRAYIAEGRGACERLQHYTVASELISLPSADKKWTQSASTITSSTSLGTAQPGHRIPKHDRETLWDTGEMEKEESLCWAFPGDLAPMSAMNYIRKLLMETRVRVNNRILVRSKLKKASALVKGLLHINLP